MLRRQRSLSFTWELPWPRTDSKHSWNGIRRLAIGRPVQDQHRATVHADSRRRSRWAQNWTKPESCRALCRDCNPVNSNFKKDWRGRITSILPVSCCRSQRRRLPRCASPLARHRGARSLELCANLHGQPGPQHRNWTGPLETGFLGLQEQLYPAHFGKFQRSVPGGSFQYSQPREFRFSHRQPGGVRSEWPTDPECGTADLHANDFTPDSICAQIDLVTRFKVFFRLCRYAPQLGISPLKNEFRRIMIRVASISVQAH